MTEFPLILNLFQKVQSVDLLVLELSLLNRRFVFVPKKEVGLDVCVFNVVNNGHSFVLLRY